MASFNNNFYLASVSGFEKNILILNMNFIKMNWNCFDVQIIRNIEINRKYFCVKLFYGVVFTFHALAPSFWAQSSKSWCLLISTDHELFRTIIRWPKRLHNNGDIKPQSKA